MFWLGVAPMLSGSIWPIGILFVPDGLRILSRRPGGLRVLSAPPIAPTIVRREPDKAAHEL